MLPQIKKSHKPVYLDHAAATPLDAKVKASMAPFWGDRFGNPSALYGQGRQASHALETARKTIAGLIGARSDEIVFTAGGTESTNLAIFGVANSSRLDDGKQPHFITTAIEHHAVLRPLEALQRRGCSVSYIDVDEFGFVKLKQLKAAVKPETVLISIMYANNEIGTVQPIAEIGKWLRSLNEQRKAAGLPVILLHTDACQAAGSLDIQVSRLGVDLLTANGSKIYGPKQVGFLYVRSGVRLQPLIYGGGQERNMRSGTENVPGAVGLAEALRLAQKERMRENRRLRKLRDYFLSRLEQLVPKIALNGPDERGFSIDDTLLARSGSFEDAKNGATVGPLRLPNNLNVSILDIEGEAMLLYLDSYGICASTGSACTSQSLDPSHVILAIGRPYEYAHGSMRFTLGRSTTKEDIDFALKVIPGVVAELRRISPINLDPQKPKQISEERAFVGQRMDKFRNKKVKKS